MVLELYRIYTKYYILNSACTSNAPPFLRADAKYY